MSAGERLKSVLIQLYRNGGAATAHEPRPSRRVLYPAAERITQIYSKSRADIKRKQKETGEVPPLTQCTRGACARCSVAAYLHAAVTSADDTSAHFFSPHERVSKRSEQRASLPRARDGREKEDHWVAHVRTRTIV